MEARLHQQHLDKRKRGGRSSQWTVPHCRRLDHSLVHTNRSRLSVAGDDYGVGNQRGNHHTHTHQLSTWESRCTRPTTPLPFRRRRLPKGASLHSLRHSQRSHLLASSVPLPAVSARLGHSSVRTTQEIYSHMVHEHDDEAARKWEEFQNQTAGGEQQKGRVQ